MAKKIRKRPPSSLWLLIKLLIPWVVMGGIALVAFSAGLSDLLTYSIALAGALTVTFLIHRIDKGKRMRQAPRQ